MAALASPAVPGVSWSYGWAVGCWAVRCESCRAAACQEVLEGTIVKSCSLQQEQRSEQPLLPALVAQGLGAGDCQEGRTMHSCSCHRGASSRCTWHGAGDAARAAAAQHSLGRVRTRGCWSGKWEESICVPQGREAGSDSAPCAQAWVASQQTGKDLLTQGKKCPVRYHTCCCQCSWAPLPCSPGAVCHCFGTVPRCPF